ncbi:MAG: N-glycosylase/DNA lyase [Candidatus Aenigmatarchaeota archaeon]
MLAQLKNSYKAKKPAIEKRLNEFKNRKDEEIFHELAFCLLTPQSRAKTCWSAIENLKKNRLLFSDDPGEIRKYMTGVRFANTKAKRIPLARRLVNEIRARRNSNPYELRDYLVKNINGYGYKEASHFLRNIGFDDFAILDRHILKNLLRYKVIDEIPKTLTKKRYLEIE